MDYELVFNEEDGEWQVWTPDDTVGAIIGTGKTESEAKADAVKNMEELCEVLMGIKAKPV
jgi:hypothetical protein